jgi:DNA polymerase-3 subunit delta'
VSGFADIRGHARIIESLRRAMQRGTVAHAYLFTGPPGVGKHTVARTFAAALNCLDRPDDACGACRSCRKMAQGNHPDFHEIAKLEDKKFILIEQIRELIKTLQYAPYEGRVKVCLIADAEQMNPEAANALLKTLEEPNARTAIILTSSAAHQLLPTVVSRCQTLRFGLLAEEEVRAWVAANMSAGEEDAALIAALAEGSVGRAATLDVEFLRGPRLALFDALAGARPNDVAAALALAEKMLETDPGLVDAVELLAGFVRDAAAWRATGDSRRLRNRDAQAAVAQYAGRMTIDALARKIRSLARARRLVERNIAKPAIAAGLCVELLSPAPTDFAKGRLPR